jgi:hypothetical protein
MLLYLSLKMPIRIMIKMIPWQWFVHPIAYETPTSELGERIA